MTDAELLRLANLATVIQHLEERGLAGTRAYELLSTERDRAILALASERPEPAPATAEVKPAPAVPTEVKETTAHVRRSRGSR